MFLIILFFIFLFFGVKLVKKYFLSGAALLGMSICIIINMILIGYFPAHDAYISEPQIYNFIFFICFFILFIFGGSYEYALYLWNKRKQKRT